jgi:hypothetical protein
MAAAVKNGQSIAKDGFIAVQKDSDEALEQKVMTWLQGFQICFLTNFHSKSSQTEVLSSQSIV